MLSHSFSLSPLSKRAFSPSLTPAQQQAIDPFASIWLTASAGSGKTKVLVDRLLALMLEGYSPQRLLCLTFTKAAAAEMSNRLHQQLSDWAVMGEEALEVSLKTFKKHPSSQDKKRARQLLVSFLDTPGGLKIQTLHSFCQFLLRQFPLEAGVNPSFSVLEERHAQELLEIAQERVLAWAFQSEKPALTQAVEHLASYLHENRLNVLIQEAFSKRLKLLKLFRQGAFEPILEDVLEIHRIGALENTWEFFIQKSLENLGTLQAFSERFQVGKARDQAFWNQAQAWIKTPTKVNYASYHALFFTEAGALRKQILSASILKACPELDFFLQAEIDLIETYEAQRKTLALYQNTHAFLTILDSVHQVYETLKKQKAVLDYDDLILNTLELLKGKRGGAGWVLYKLDKGIDHILVDEAQDTSEEQWEVIRLLTEEFFSHNASVPTLQKAPRTLFVVGDPKQSIYRFQGASPQAFFRMQQHFREQVMSSQGRWYDLQLETSFRSSPAILEAVDLVFQNSQLNAGVYKGVLSHQACEAKKDSVGIVEVWSPVPVAEKKEKATPWELPLPPNQLLPPYVYLAQALASTFQQWFQRQERRASGELLKPQDILILVRRRTFFVDSLVRCLKEKKIPVAGADRLFFADQLAVADLLKLGEFLLFVEDDLTLATVLKGPFIGMGEEALFELAWNRGSQTLWSRLQEKAPQQAVFKEASHFLSMLLEEIKLFFSPYVFYQRLLTVHAGKRKILERLGLEAQDALEAFLNLALAYERTHPPSLQGFLAWLTRAEVNIKRDLEHDARDEVRIMTVHGSKGLQAPVVILADACQAPSSTASPLLWGEAKETFFLLLAPPASEDTSLSKKLKEEEIRLQDEEYHRLLYVGMTRAEERLYVTGWQQAQKTAFDKSWYPFVEQALSAHPAVQAFPFHFEGKLDWKGEGYRLQTGVSSFITSVNFLGVPVEEPALPPWATLMPTSEKEIAFLSPSLGLQERSGVEAFHIEKSEEGKVLHRILQLLVGMPEEKRLSSMEKALQHHDKMSSVYGEKHAQFRRILNNPACHFLFDTQTRAEVPVTALINGRRLLGQIDYLWVDEVQVRIVDFKTGQHPPQTLSQIPSQYLKQLAAYATSVSQIYPEKTVSCGLLWMVTGELQWVPPELLQC